MSSDATDRRESSRRDGALRWCRRNVHFLLAAGILLGTTVGWDRTVAALDWALQKEPVPWREGVVVDAETFNLVSFPERIGPYVLAGDGELERSRDDDTPITDGRPDGDVVIKRSDVLDSLKIATVLDKMRVSDRKSNWYAIRIFRDARVANPRERAYGYWRLEVYYYTGGLDTVPHIPEVCGQAAGATPDRSKSKTVRFSSPEGTPAPWSGKVPFERVWFEKRDEGRGPVNFVQYYTFSLNGRPEESWKAVRLTLTKPWVRQCYFAKIQISPLGGVGYPDEADEATGRFFKAVCPELLKLLPMPGDIDKRTRSVSAAGSPR